MAHKYPRCSELQDHWQIGLTEGAWNGERTSLMKAWSWQRALLLAVEGSKGLDVVGRPHPVV
jgi:hypothetical protein